MTCGGTYPLTVLPAGRGEPADVENPISTAMSAFCFAQMMWRTVARAATGKVISFFKQKLGQANVTSLVERVSRFTAI